MELIAGLLALLLAYVGQDRCSCEDAGTCLHCVSSRALVEAETELPTAFAAANFLPGPAVHRRFQQPLAAAGAGEPRAAPPARLIIAKAHSDGPFDTPDHCDFALIHVSAELAQVLLAYRDALDCLAAGMKHRFAAAASCSHELEIFPSVEVDFLGLGHPVEELPADDPLRAGADAAIEGDLALMLPPDFDRLRYPLDDVTERTDTDHCLVSRDGVRFCSYAGDTRVFTTDVGWNLIEAVWEGGDADGGAAEGGPPAE